MKRALYDVALVGLAALAAGCSPKTFDIGEVDLLEVTSVDPHDGAVGVPRTVVITVRFSDAVSPDSLFEPPGAVELLAGAADAGGAPVSAALQLDAARTTLAVVPDTPLDYGATYTLRLSTAVARDDGLGVLAGEVSSTFTIEAQPPALEVQSYWPGDQDGEVPLEDADEVPSRPFVIFNHALDRSAALADHAEVTDVDAATAVVGTWTLSENGRQMIFAPDAPWRFGQRVRVRVLAGLPDVYGGSLADELSFTFDFAFQSTKLFEVTSHFPLDGQSDVLREDGAGLPTEVVISFTDPVDETANWASAFSVTDTAAAAEVPGAWRLDAATSSAIFTPAAAWGYEQAVEVVVAQGLLGVGRGALAEEVRFGFVFAPPPPFFGVSFFPPDGKQDVQPADATGQPTAIEVFFNEPPAALPNWEAFCQVHDVTVPSSEIDLGPAGSWTIDATEGSVVFRLNPGQTWSFSQSVRVRVMTGLQGVSDGVLAETIEFGFTFSSPSELVVMRSEPPDGAERIPLTDAVSGGDKQISVYFNEALDTGEDWAAHFTVDEVLPGDVLQAVPGSWALDDGDESTTFTPDGPWHFGQRVQVKVESGLLGASGSGLTADRVFSFTFEAPPPLAVIGVEPADGAERVPRDDGADSTPIRISFSEGLDPTSVSLTTDVEAGSITLADVGGVPFAGTLELADGAAADDTVVFRPADPWAYSAEVVVTVGFSVRSVRGATLGQGAADDEVSSFLFEDPPAMLLLTRHPAPSAPDVLTATDLSWTFSRPLDPASVTDANLSVYLDSDAGQTNLCQLGVAATLDGAGTTLGCDPVGGFPAGEKVWVALTAGADGLKSVDATSRGGWLDEQTADLTYSFDVKAAPELKIVAAFPPPEPGGGPATEVDPRTAVRVIFDRPLDTASVDANSFTVRECLTAAPCPDAGDGNDLPATQTCAAGENCIAFARGDAEVSWTHATRLQYSTFYTVLIADTIISADGVAEMPAGGFVYSFETTDPPPMIVESTEPSPGDTGLTRRPVVRIRFDRPIDGSSLLNDPFGGDGELPNVFLNRGPSTDRDAELVYGSDYTLELEDPETVRLNLLHNLTLGESYTVTSTLDLRNVETGKLVTPHHFVFTIRSSSLLVRLTPPDNATGVPVVGTVVEAEFEEPMDPTTITAATFGLLAEDPYGRLHPVPGSVSYDGGSQTASFTPADARVGHCARADWPLIHDTRYRVRLSPRIASLADETLGAVSAGFRTGPAPGVTGMRSLGALVGDTVDDRDPLGGAEDVPQNSTLHVDFDQPMDGAAFVASPVPAATDTVRLELHPPAGQPGDPTAVPVSVSYGGLTLDVTPDSLLEAGRRYTLRVKGKDAANAAWALTADAQPLASSLAAQFDVAPALQANLTLVQCLPCCQTSCHWSGAGANEEPWVCTACDCDARCKPPLTASPPPSLEGEAPFEGGVISAIFNRPVPRTEIEASLSLMVNGGARTCGIGYPETFAGDPSLAQSVTCTPAPALQAGDTARVILSGALEDEQGNPLLEPIDRTLEDAVAAPLTGGDPQVFQLNVAGLPVALGSVTGDQVFRVVFGASVPDLRVDPATLHGGSAGGAPADAAIAMFDETAGDAFVPVAVTPQPQQSWSLQREKPDPDADPIPMDSPDYADFQPLSPLQVGHTYRIEVRGTTLITTLAGLNLDSDFSDTVDVETDRPTVTAVQIRKWDAGLSQFYWTDAASLTDVPADTPVRLEFSETLDLASAQSEVLLQEQGGSLVSTTMTVEQPPPVGGFGLVLTPDAPLTAGQTYEVLVSASLEDVSGQSKAVLDLYEFTVDAGPLTITASAPSGAGNALDSQIVLDFSSPVDPLSFRAGAVDVPADNPATVWLEHATEQGGPNPCGTLIGSVCVSFADHLREVTLTPVGPGLVPHRQYDVVLDAAEVSDLGGAQLDAAYGPLQFETAEGAPALLCTDPAPDELMTREDPLALYFTEAMDLTTLGEHAKLVHRESGIEANMDLAALPEAGSYTLTPAAGEPLHRAALYSLEVSGLALDEALVDGLDPPYFTIMSTYGLVINEVLYQPPGIGDAVNCDTSASAANDEFVEVLNTGAEAVDLSGFTLESASVGLRHTFASGTVLPAGGAMLVFGGGNLEVTCSFDVPAVTASSGGLGLDWTDILWLKTDDGLVLDVAQWDDPVGREISIVRDPEGSGGFTAHSVAEGSGGEPYSPGTHTDGSAF